MSFTYDERDAVYEAIQFFNRAFESSHDVETVLVHPRKQAVHGKVALSVQSDDDKYDVKEFSEGDLKALLSALHKIDAAKARGLEAA